MKHLRLVLLLGNYQQCLQKGEKMVTWRDERKDIFNRFREIKLNDLLRGFIICADEAISFVISIILFLPLLLLVDINDIGKVRK